MRPNTLGLLVICGLVGCRLHDDRDVAKSATRLDLARDFLRKHQLEAADTECNRALAFNPASDEAYNTRGLVAMIRALDIQRTLEIDACLTGVDAELTQRDLDRFLHTADRAFGEANRISPDYGEAWSNRGVVHNLLEDYTAAAAYLTEALANPMRLDSPGLTRAHLGWALFHEARYVDAAKELRQAVQFQPNMCVATYRLARVYFERQEWEKAAELFQTTSDDPACGSQEASLYLMKTRMQQGLVDDARRARDACLKLSPKSCIAVQCRAEGRALGAPAVAAHP
ncbi:MAG: tetratricopeptide repeat protein [Deltaproteobacteria bacterium]|nr:MAG: tetratricopeptide repeat protein [Deltaproteobacteria bacterium]